MTEPNKIGGINVTAPLWNKATEAELRAIVASLSSASYHYADNSGREWGTARAAKASAASEVNRLRLSSMAIQALYADRPQLVTRDDFMDAVLSDARAKAKLEATE